MAGIRAVLMGLALGALTLQPMLARAQVDPESAVKAGYLIRFAAFVEWPRSAFDGPRSPLAVCVVGRDPFGSVLDRAAAGRTAYGRPIEVRRPSDHDGAVGCHILYVGQGGAVLADTLAGRRGLLIVTSEPSDRGRGMIHFATQQSRVRFHIDLAAASRAGLAISSRLLDRALSVGGG